VCPGRQQTPSAPVAYTITTPTQVTSAIVCDIASAAKETKGHDVDFSKAVISAEITFSEVTKNSAGASLTVAAIPVFSGASAAPSLDASRVTSETVQSTTSFTVDPAQLVPCSYSSPNKWLTSQVVTGHINAVRVTKVSEAVQFVVTKKAGAGLKLNIVPVSIGPQFSTENNKAQKICLVFDFDKQPGKPQDKPSCPSGSGSGSGGNPNQ
jgi:hypothetical protein